MSDITLNTNLASEFHVLSMLYRIGANAHLTLGNKKSIDIVVEKDDHNITIDVKGLRDESIFPLDNFKDPKKNHYVVFVTFLKKTSDYTVMPETYIVPSEDLPPLIYQNPKRTRRGIKLKVLRSLKAKYLIKWGYFSLPSSRGI